MVTTTSAFKFKIGGDTSGTRLLPESERVKVRFADIQHSQWGDNRLSLHFQLEDPNHDDEEIAQASEDNHIHFENANIPPGDKIGKRTRMYFFLKGMSGDEFDEDDDADFEDYLDTVYWADFEHVDAQEPSGDGSFRVKRDDRGKAIRKARITKLRPVKERRAAASQTKPAVQEELPEDDDDLFAP